MGRSKRWLAKERLEPWNLLVGMLAGLVGLYVALGGPVWKPGDSKKTELENELRAVGPRLDVSYLFLTGDVFTPRDEQATSTTKLPMSKKAVALVSYPTIDTGIVDEQDVSAEGCGLGETVESSQAYLVIENHGKRDATEITVRADKLQLTAPVRVYEAGGDEYLAKLRAGARSTEPEVIRIPLSLTSGEGVRVPLWVNYTPQDRSSPWCVVSRTALLPTSLGFVDPDLKAEETMKVRPLKDPLKLADGIRAGG